MPHWVFSVTAEDNSNTATPTAATFTVTVVSTNDLPIVDMNGGANGNDNAISFTEIDGADDASAAVALVASGTNLSDADSTLSKA